MCRTLYETSNNLECCFFSYFLFVDVEVTHSMQKNWITPYNHRDRSVKGA